MTRLVDVGFPSAPRHTQKEFLSSRRFEAPLVVPTYPLREALLDGRYSLQQRAVAQTTQHVRQQQPPPVLKRRHTRRERAPLDRSVRKLSSLPASRLGHSTHLHSLSLSLSLSLAAHMCRYGGVQTFGERRDTHDMWSPTGMVSGELSGAWSRSVPTTMRDASPTTLRSSSVSTSSLASAASARASAASARLCALASPVFCERLDSKLEWRSRLAT